MLTDSGMLSRAQATIDAVRVLMIEDEVETACAAGAGLETLGMHVTMRHDGEAGMACALAEAFDVLVIDRMLPGLDGLSLLRALREREIDTPALFLTAAGGLQDRVDGLTQGADDYLVKPFYQDELNARVHALARRRTAKRERIVLSAGGMTLDRLAREAHVGDAAIELLPLEFKLLEYLMQNAGRPVTRAMLLERVWGFQFDPRTNIVETHISRLRGKLEQAGAKNPIRTVRGAGYLVGDD